MSEATLQAVSGGFRFASPTIHNCNHNFQTRSKITISKACDVVYYPEVWVFVRFRLKASLNG